MGSVLIDAVMPEAAIVGVLHGVGANITACFLLANGRKNPLEVEKMIQPSTASAQDNQIDVSDDEVQSWLMSTCVCVRK